MYCSSVISFCRPPFLAAAADSAYFLIDSFQLSAESSASSASFAASASFFFVHDQDADVAGRRSRELVVRLFGFVVDSSFDFRFARFGGVSSASFSWIFVLRIWIFTRSLTSCSVYLDFFRNSWNSAVGFEVLFLSVFRVLFRLPSGVTVIPSSAARPWIQIVSSMLPTVVSVSSSYCFAPGFGAFFRPDAATTCSKAQSNSAWVISPRSWVTFRLAVLDGLRRARLRRRGRPRRSRPSRRGRSACRGPRRPRSRRRGRRRAAPKASRPKRRTWSRSGRAWRRAFAFAPPLPRLVRLCPLLGLTKRAAYPLRRSADPFASRKPFSQR